MKRRRKTFSGTPQQHQERARMWLPDVTAAFRDAITEAKDGQCDLAVRSLTRGFWYFGAMSEHQIEGQGVLEPPESNTVARLRNAAEMTFRRRCLRRTP
jgi:hypothetical protein